MAETVRFEVDWPAFLRLDNAAVIDFLASTTNALARHGQSTQMDADNLRVALGSISADPNARSQPVLTALEAQAGNVLAPIVARYGITGLSLNLARHTLRTPILRIRYRSVTLARDLIRKAEQLFNRPFYVYRGVRCLRHSLYSTVLVELADQVTSASEDLQKIADDMSQLCPADLASYGEEDRLLDEAVAMSLGFEGLSVSAMPTWTDPDLMRRSATVLTNMVGFLEAFDEQLAENSRNTRSIGVVGTACSWLRAECQRLVLPDLPRYESLSAWELRRRNLASSLNAIVEALRVVQEGILSTIVPEAPREPKVYPEAVQRRIINALITQGVPAAAAMDASEKLFHYLGAQNIKPGEVLAAELPRIHPALTTGALSALVTVAAPTTPMGNAAAEKASTMARAQKLTQKLKDTLDRIADSMKTALPIAFLCFFLASGCGLKTRPQSDLPDLRPEIPFRPQLEVGPPKSAAVAHDTPSGDGASIPSTATPESSQSDKEETPVHGDSGQQIPNEVPQGTR